MSRKLRPDVPLNLNWQSSLDLKTKVTVGAGVVDQIGTYLSQLKPGRRVLVVHQPFFACEKLSAVLADLADNQFETDVLQLPDGESGKSADTLLTVWQKMQECGLTRRDTLIGIGGGAVTDLSGFASSTYLRGINLMLVPTTLLAQVDAGIGGKTGINLASGKNLAGTFYFAQTILVDTHMLESLPSRQFAAGMAEVVKYAMLELTIAAETEYKMGPRPLFQFLEEHANSESFAHDPAIAGIVMSCIQMKLAVVAKDPYEKGLRRCLNLGHTLAHGLEKASNFGIPHGEAVAIGLVFATKLAHRFGLCDEHMIERTIKVLGQLALPTFADALLDRALIKKAMLHDKKRTDHNIRMVLPKQKFGLVDYDYPVDVQDLSTLMDQLDGSIN